MKHYKVVAAIIVNDNKILCMQRGVGKFDYISKKYEFPGGKVEQSESNAEALKREISEELKMNINVKDEFLTVDHQYPDFRLTMVSFICEADDISLTLTEHIDYQWLDSADLNKLDWAAADIPIVKKLMND